MRHYPIVFVLFLFLLGAAAAPALAVPLGIDGGDQGFFYAVTSVAVNYDSGVGFGFGGGFYIRDGAAVFVEAGEGAYGVGSWFEPADNLLVAAKYEHVTGWTYTWYGWDYVEIDGFLLGAYYKLQSGGLLKGPNSDKDFSLIGVGAATATDGYDTATAFFLEFQSLSYVGENAALTTALSVSDGVIVSTLGLAVGF